MKKLSFITAMLFTVAAYAQEKLLEILPLKDSIVTYTGVVQVDSTSKEVLYKKAKKWFVDSYKSAKDVIQLDDKENGDIIGKGIFEVVWQVTFMSTQKTNVHHTVKISVKDNKFKYTITDFRIVYYVTPSQYTSGKNIDKTIESFGGGMREKNTKKYFAEVDMEVNKTIASLIKAMKDKEKEDW